LDPDGLEGFTRDFASLACLLAWISAKDILLGWRLRRSERELNTTAAPVHRVLLTITPMDITSPESLDDRLRQVKIDEIDPSKASTQASKSRHNELAPISRLPCEVLAIIFTFLSLFAWNKGSSILAWINAAHVCRRWRETALNHPRY
jgi:hypothetical protein